jgi:2-desacetyl-2-hydroxyethyl bacteriochlorophyllide A dehydrogenase
MKAALLHKPYDIRVEDVEDPKIGPEDVLLEQVHTGICGSDVNRYKGIKEMGEPVYPIILGHEMAGVVAKVGEKVKGFQPGDRVWGINFQSLTQYYSAPQSKLFKLPDGIPLEHAQSLGPLGGTLHAIHVAGIQIGYTVAVLGPGHAGLVLTQWAKIAGADRVITIGTRENRLQVAKGLGADFVVNAKSEDPVKRVKEITGGSGADVVIEAAGRPDAVRQAVEMVKTDGTIVIYGLGQEPVDGFDIFAVYRKRIRMIGTQGRTDRERETVVKYMASGKISVKPIISHVLSLEETKRGFEIVDKRLDDAIRVVIKCD